MAQPTITEVSEDLPEPKSLEEVERLVQSLYQPGSPRRISQAERALQKIQRSSQGWQLADALLQSQIANVRFFGALTFCIKINKDWLENCFEIVQRLGDAQLLTSLWFVTTLVEEVGKTSSESIQTHKYHERVLCNLDDMVTLLRHGLNGKSHNINLAEEGMKCYHALVMYAHRAWIDKAMALDPIRLLIPQAVQHLGDNDMFDVTVEFFTDVMTNFSSFFLGQHYVLIASILCAPAAEEKISSLRAGDFDSDAMAFGRLLLAFGDANLSDLAKHNDTPSNRRVLDMLTSLLTCEGYAVSQDEICSQTLEFWTTYIEHLTDALFAEGESKPEWMPPALQYVIRSIEACWIKIRMPPPEVAINWDTEARTGFKAFRADVEDLIQSSYTLLGIDLFERFIRLALEALGSQDWLHLEATLFCIKSLADPISDGEVGDEGLARLFGSSLFSQMSNDTLAIPAKTQQTAVTMINRYTSFFERHAEYLPPTLNFLFNAIKTTSLGIAAPRAIFAISSSCRKNLVLELGAFLEQYKSLTNATNIDASAKEQVIGAIAAIIQAIPVGEAQIQPLSQLLQFVEADIQKCLQLQLSTQIEELEQAYAIGLCALRCLTNMGKGLQVHEDEAIDLDADKPTETIWEHGSGLTVQSRIIQCFGTVFSSLRHDGDIIEATCHILRTGYTETSPGPFVFAPKVSEDIVTSSDLTTPRLAYVLDTAGIMLSRNSARSSDELDHAALSCLGHLIYLINALDCNPGTDPEIASSCIDLVEKTVARYPKLLLVPEIQASIPSLFTFTLVCLVSTEIYPKRAAAAFWVRTSPHRVKSYLIVMSKCSVVQLRNLPADIQAMVDSVIHEYGPLVCLGLVRGIAGEAARSELDALIEPLKKLVFRQPRAKQWLSDALFNDSFPSPLVSETDKKIWLQKVMK
ncbi:MAG: hypothetical protein Q9187_003767 [Circinaria calcarea]